MKLNAPPLVDGDCNASIAEMQGFFYRHSSFLKIQWPPAPLSPNHNCTISIPPPLEDPEDDGKNAPSEDTPSTGDPQGPTPGYNPWENDDSNVVIDTRTEERKQADLEETRRASEAVTGTIQAGGLGGN